MQKGERRRQKAIPRLRGCKTVDKLMSRQGLIAEGRTKKQKTNNKSFRLERSETEKTAWFNMRMYLICCQPLWFSGKFYSRCLDALVPRLLDMTEKHKRGSIFGLRRFHRRNPKTESLLRLRHVERTRRVSRDIPLFSVDTIFLIFPVLPCIIHPIRLQ